MCFSAVLIRSLPHTHRGEDPEWVSVGPGEGGRAEDGAVGGRLARADTRAARWSGSVAGNKSGLAGADFFALHPDLHAFLLECLQAATASLSNDADKATDSGTMHPWLYPVLIVLARLRPSLTVRAAVRCAPPSHRGARAGRSADGGVLAVGGEVQWAQSPSGAVDGGRGPSAAHRAERNRSSLVAPAGRRACTGGCWSWQ